MRFNINNIIIIKGLRLSLSFIFLTISLLALFDAPTNFLWKLSIAVTEYGYIFLVIFTIPLISKWWGSKSGRISALLCLSAIVIVSSVLVRASYAASALPDAIKPVFNSIPREPFLNHPFSFKSYLHGFDLPKAKVENRIYTSGDINLDLDFYHPVNPNKPVPCVLVVHGGGWDSGDKKQLPALNYYLAGQGYAVAAITYRLAPQHVFPSPLKDIEKAIKYLKNNAQELGIDTGKFTLLGRSAGGQIALLYAYTKNDPSIKGVISFYAPADMIWGYSLPCNPLILDSRKVMEQYLGGTYGKVPEVFKASSPNEFVSKNAPPTLLIHGKRDEMVAYEHSRRLDSLLRYHNVSHFLVTLPWATHGCDYNLNGPSGQISTYAIERFLASVNNR